MERQKYELIFIEESEHYLSDLGGLLLRVEKTPSDRDLWGEIHGKIHSIKGMARALSLDKITKLGHLMETWCKAFQQGSQLSTPDVIQSFFEGADILNRLVVRMGEIDSFETQQWYSSLITLFEKIPQAETKNSVRKKPDTLPAINEVQSINEVRVRYALIEELLGLAQEIQLLEKTLPPLPEDKAATNLKNWINHYASLIKVLHFRLSQLRLMSIGDFTQLFQKTVRNLARENGKQVFLEVTGGEIQADITLLERFREPLLHLFRNCIAHGIESPAEREAAGKNPEGRIMIDARSEKESLLITISDDGRGIDRASIVQHLKKKQNLSDEDIQAIPDEDLLSSILSPDYSSAKTATELAGRGIGMNVVAQAISYLGGSLCIASTPAQGTAFKVRLPLSLSIVYAITFKIGGFTLSIPTAYVDSIVRAANLTEKAVENVYPLSRTLGIEQDEPAFLNIIELKPLEERAQSGPENGRLRIPADHILGNRPLMVMPTGELLSRAHIYAGVGIMDDGEISMLLDIENLP